MYELDKENQFLVILEDVVDNMNLPVASGVPYCMKGDWNQPHGVVIDRRAEEMGPIRT